MPQSIILIARIVRDNQSPKAPKEDHIFQMAYADFASSPFCKEGQEAKLPETGDRISDFPLSDGYSVSFFVGKVTPSGSCVEVELTKMLFKKGGTLIPEINSNAQFTIFKDSEWRCPEFAE